VEARDRKRVLAPRIRWSKAGTIRPHQLWGMAAAALLLAARASADVDVLLTVVAVMAEVEDLMVGQTADGSIGVVVLGDMHP
jgi:hypothetical protein